MSAGEHGKAFLALCVPGVFGHAAWCVSDSSASPLETRLPEQSWQSSAALLALADGPGWARAAPRIVPQQKPCACGFPAGTWPLFLGCSQHQTPPGTERLVSLYLWAASDQSKTGAAGVSLGRKIDGRVRSAPFVPSSRDSRLWSLPGRAETELFLP